MSSTTEKAPVLGLIDTDKHLHFPYINVYKRTTGCELHKIALAATSANPRPVAGHLRHLTCV